MKKHIIHLSKEIMGEKGRYIRDTEWSELLKICNVDNIFSIRSIDLTVCDKTLEVSIVDYYENNIQIVIEGDLKNGQVVVNVTSFYKNGMNAHWKENQLLGIQQALDKKRNGLGNYGRPKIELPMDFEEAIHAIKRKEYTAKDYMKKTGMKKSTFYKYSSKVKQGKM